MRILILGAGRAGRSVAENLVDSSNDITIVDTDRARIEELQRHLDLRGVVGDAASPKVLKAAGAEDVDMVIALTASDETNLVCSLLAAKLFNIPTRIARVRKNDLRDYSELVGENGFQVTSVIWPEETVTDALQQLIRYPEVLRVLNFDDGNAAIVTLRAMQNSPMVNQPIRVLSEHLPNTSVSIVSIYRHNKPIDITPTTVVLEGDEVVALSAKNDIDALIHEIHWREKPIHNVVLTGENDQVVSLANKLNNSQTSYNIKVITRPGSFDPDNVATLPRDTLFVEGFPADEETLARVGIDACDTFVSLSRDDKTNIMSTLLAKRMGAKRVISLVDNQTFGELIEGTPIDVIVSSTQTMLGELLKHIRHGDVVSAQTLRRGEAEAIEVIAHGDTKTSKVIGRSINALKTPDGVRIAGIVRHSQEGGPRVLPTEPTLVIEPNDHVIVFVSNKQLITQVENLFAVDVGFF